MSSSSQASADAATLSAESREIAARLIRWFLDDFTRTSIAPVVNQAMSVTSGDITILAFSTPLKRTLPSASHDLQAVLAMIPAEVAPIENSWMALRLQWSISFYKIHSCVNISSSGGNPHDDHGKYWVKQGYRELENLWRSIEDESRTAETRGDIFSQIAQGARDGDRDASRAMSWFLDWQAGNSPAAKGFWDARKKASPSYHSYDEESISGHR